MSTPLHIAMQQLQGNRVIAVQFPNTAELNRRFKQLPGARWSQTLQSWYVPDTVAYRKRFGLVNATAQQAPLQNDTPIPAAPLQSGVPPTQSTRLHPCNIAVLVQVKEQLVLKGYSTSTHKTYLNELSQLLQLLGNRPAMQLGPADLRRYFLYCYEKLQLSENTLHSRINAIKFYYEHVLRREKFFWDIPRPKKQLQVPRFFNQN